MTRNHTFTQGRLMASSQMPGHIHTRRRWTVTSETLEAAALVLFFAEPFFRWVIGFALPGLAGYIALILPYIPAIMLLVAKRGMIKKPDFFVLLLGVVLFFLLTYLTHPSYAFWYKRDYYGVWDYVLRPDNGLYAYFFLRLADDPRRILKNLKIASILGLICYGFTFVQAVNRGYWITIWAGETVKTSYSLEFGYDILLYVLVFLYSALKYKKLPDWIVAAVGLFMIVGGGSRGPVLDVAIFIALYLLAELGNAKNKALIIAAVIAGAVLIYFTYVPLMALLSGLMEKVGISSRFIRMMIEGTVSDDNGRVLIWNRALEMIRDNPFGYGAMGTRHVIYYIIQVGHPHNVFLEILVDFGVFAGTGLILAGLISVIRIISMKEIGEWKGLFLIFCGVSCQLLLSGTYWHRTGIWGTLAIGMSIHYYKYKKGAQIVDG